MSLRAATFWGSVATSSWVLVGYPAALALRGARPWVQDDATPSMTVLVPAYREREALVAKLDGLAEVDWPADRLQVLVVVDEDEETARLARAHPIGCEVLFSPERNGKANALNRGLARATGDVVVLTDANNVLAPDSLRATGRHFADPHVTGVAGRRGEVSSAYDRYEDLLRRLETRSGTCAAASGEFFAVRRDRLPDAFGDDVVNDDLWLLCQLVRAGGRVVYEPRAASVEDALGARAELTRRSRIGAGRVALLGELRGLPRGFALRLVSHKFGRLVLPFTMLAAAVSSLSLLRRRPYRRLVIAQALLYLGGAVGASGRAPRGKAGLPLRALGQFVVGNVAVGTGVVRGLRGGQDVRWEPVR